MFLQFGRIQQSAMADGRFKRVLWQFDGFKPRVLAVRWISIGFCSS